MSLVPRPLASYDGVEEVAPAEPWGAKDQRGTGGGIGGWVQRLLIEWKSNPSFIEGFLVDTKTLPKPSEKSVFPPFSKNDGGFFAQE